MEAKRRIMSSEGIKVADETFFKGKQRRRLCRFVNTRRGCLKGQECDFYHRNGDMNNANTKKGNNETRIHTT